MVEKAKWKLLKLPLQEKMINQNQYHIPRGITDFSASTKDLRAVEVGFLLQLLHPSCFTYAEDRCGLRLDYLQLTQVLILFTADVPDVVGLLNQIQTSPGAR